ncbi:MAG: outer membrane beta-barrel protein [Chitinophagales bacterium]
MQSDNLDKAIKEAADHHHPAYDENAWNKMEKLLDKHLPQEKDDRRRIIFSLLMFLLLGGGAWFFISKPWKSGKPASDLVNQTQPSSHTPVNPVLSDKEKTVSTTAGIVIKEQNEKSVNPEKENDLSLQGLSTRQYNIIASQNVIKLKQKETGKTNGAAELNKITSNKNSSGVTVVPDKSNEVQPLTLNADKKSNNSPVTENTSVAGNSKQENISSVKTNEEQKITDKAEPSNQNNAVTSATSPVLKKNAGKNQKKNPFFFSVSAGAEINAAGINSLGKLKPTYGAGIGYTFHNKFTLRTGFYVSRKIYTASPDEYHPPSSFWTYYPDLKKVDADCKVFEIPLLLSYNFSNTKDHSLYGTVGISSYLMKRETYSYLSQPASGIPTTRKFTLNNKNKHYFSVLDLGGGYQRNINNTLSIAAEPYVKIPFDGIGFGKMQLNSAGVLVTLDIKPFNGSKKKK